MKKIFTILALTGVITACGGNDSSDNSSTPNPPVTKTGILTDGVISGVSYSTNSGLTGMTGANGEFQYKDGDKVKFTIGSVQLGDEITAQARVTPLDLAQEDNRRTNLLVFLQSLDRNRQHDDGISVDKDTSDALKGVTINFNQSPANFIIDPVFITSLTNAKLPTTPISPEQAKKNFQKAFYKDIAGVWQFFDNSNTQVPEVLIYIAEDGTYYLGEFTPEDDVGAPGIEVGKLNWDAINTKISPSIEEDSNGEWGLSHPIGYHTLGFDGNNLIIGEPNIQETYIGTRVSNKADNIVGSWIYTDDANQVFSFFESGYYIMLDPAGDTYAQPGEPPCGGAGVEFGKYTINNQILNIHNVSIDTNGCAGIHDEDGASNLPFSINKDKLELGSENGTAKFDRIQ
ncbi:hypothetical protein [Acinetobacter tianfuensis]|uniref:Uncharacterized protein n=1 Tax=Acinetobacter tianfuensis TaxID=2419603 RepID=A0A3A8E5H4_9GAMM|nr:hypothetical protein [Acinetobacter tianfuensis]RKG29875.1 hypothetical protein D7V32_13030 [Acinetobacter tianfuensis]